MPTINITVRAYAVTLKGKGHTRREIEQETGVKPSQLSRLVQKAKERGWKEGTIALDTHVADRSRPGRPRRIVGDIAERTISIVDEHSVAGGVSTLQVVQELDKPAPGHPNGIRVASRTVRRFLRSQGFESVVVEKTTKPGRKKAQE